MKPQAKPIPGMQMKAKPESHCHASCRLTRLTNGWLKVDRYQLRNREGKAYASAKAKPKAAEPMR
jgi:hypothetical protein